MKYLKRYEKFLNENVKNISKNIDKELLLVENQVLRDFSSSLWSMSLSSEVFSIEEKEFIKENLLNSNIDLVREGWFADTIQAGWDKAKEVGGKVWDTIKSKVDIIKNNIKSLCAGIADFIKSFFTSISSTISSKSAALKEKVKAVFPEKVKGTLQKAKPNDEELGSELKQLSATNKHVVDHISSKKLFGSSIDAADDSVINSATEQAGKVEDELKNDSLNHDILKSFYITEADEVEYKVGDTVKYKMKDGGEAEKEIVKIDGDNIFFKDKEGKEFSKPKSDILGGSKEGSKDKGKVATAWGGFAKWFLDMEEATPPEKGKAVWWIKLILKIVALLLSPIVKALEVAAKYIASNVLKGYSIVSQYLKGPGPFDFLILGGIIAGIPALVTEFTLVSHKMPEQWAHIFEIMSHFLSELAGMKVLITVFGAICTAMTFAQLVTEFKHLFGHGHGEHAHGEEHKETETETGEVKPGAPTTPAPAPAK
jgi:hypothetical protein